MGSEMCIRDSLSFEYPESGKVLSDISFELSKQETVALVGHSGACLLYTSDAADERSSVDLGGRRIINKKKQTAIE